MKEENIDSNAREPTSRSVYKHVVRRWPECRFGRGLCDVTAPGDPTGRDLAADDGKDGRDGKDLWGSIVTSQDGHQGDPRLCFEPAARQE